jgi:hypothetical protein
MLPQSPAQAAVAASGPGSAGSLEAVISALRSASDVARRVGYPADPDTANFHKLALMLLATSYNYCFATDANSPAWVPYGANLYPWAASNPDTVYRFAALDGRGVYRVAGRRGTETFATIMLRKGHANTGQGPGPTLGEIDLASFDVAPDGTFSVILSAEKPADHAGQWIRMDPRTTTAFVRQVLTRPSQRDSEFYLERLDQPPATESDNKASQERLAHITGYFPAVLEFNLKSMRDLIEKGGKDRFVGESFAASGGMPAQMYFSHLFDIAEDEVVVIESEVPQSIKYWGVQVFDEFFNTTDFIYRQSSLNMDQAVRDADGKVRMFLSPHDPGLRNWLDTSGLRKGGVMWRWHTASSFPEPTVRVVKRSALAAGFRQSPRVSQDERGASLRARTAFFQGRKRW